MSKPLVLKISKFPVLCLPWWELGITTKANEQKNMSESQLTLNLCISIRATNSNLIEYAVCMRIEHGPKSSLRGVYGSEGEGDLNGIY